MRSARAAAAAHLARRFFGSLRPGGPALRDEQWVASLVSPAESALWRRMSGPDRRHAVAVARRVQRSLGPTREADEVLVAALFHDVGKIDAGLGAAGRVLATVCGLMWGRSAAARWSEARGWRGRIGRYLRHPARGAELLRAAGSHRLAVAWAAEHHRPLERCTVPAHVAAALREADDD